MGNRNCSRYHTKYQPSITEWMCPNCGSRDRFSVYDSDFYGCDALHNSDFVHCEECHYEAKGSVVARRLAEKHSLVPCPTCKGHGMVPVSLDPVRVLDFVGELDAWTKTECGAIMHDDFLSGWMEAQRHVAELVKRAKRIIEYERSKSNG